MTQSAFATPPLLPEPVVLAHAAYVRHAQALPADAPVAPPVFFAHLAGTGGDAVLDVLVIRLHEVDDPALPLEARLRTADEAIAALIEPLQAARSEIAAAAEHAEQPSLPLAA